MNIQLTTILLNHTFACVLYLFMECKEKYSCVLVVSYIWDQNIVGLPTISIKYKIM